MPHFDLLSPRDGALLLRRDYDDAATLDAALGRARRAARSWARTPLAERLAAVSAFVDQVQANEAALAREIALQMGRPLAHCPGELRGFVDRARTMMRLAPEALADVVPPDKEGFRRFIRREPLGVVLVLAPWNYPWLTAVNAVVPALVAGDVVVLKHSEQTALVGLRLAEAARAAGLPEGVFEAIFATHEQVAGLIADPRVDHVAFTGSVEGGHAVTRAASGRFMAPGLELGGKDPAYVRADADPRHAAENLVDGACYNAGQSCCAVERAYVHRDLFDDFIAAAVEAMAAYRLGDPLDEATTLGPMVRAANADRVRAQVAEALARGAEALVSAEGFPLDRPGTPWCAPQLLIGVDHDMALMREETFGPVLGVMPVSGDEEALRLMNDSRYGLTASIWTRDAEAALALGAGLETGTVFMNRCDFLDPELAWVGVKDSGRGCTLSRVGYESLTRPKSFHLRLA